jgi:hypothetical protein
MDERQIVDSIGKLTGVVTALEMQVQVLLLAAVKAGMEPDDVLQAIEAMPEPNVPSLGKDAYDQARVCGLWAYIVPCYSLKQRQKSSSMWACRCRCGHTIIDS